MIDPVVQYFHGRDGTELAYCEIGEGRAVILIHGFLTSAEHWLRSGHAGRLAELGYRVVMPDVRAHGSSAKPHDADAYAADVPADDGFALIEHLGLEDYDLGGYSLGARTTIRMLARGARPGRAVVGGMGLEGIVNTAGRGGYFRNLLTNLGTFEFGSPEWKAEAYLRKSGGDPVALLKVLGTTVDTSVAELAAIATPTLVVVGSDDERNSSAEALADAFADGTYVAVPGDHTSAVNGPEFGEAIAAFLGDPTTRD
jgi:pimeloyl-ACP methyl ester carboxylesterase